MPKMGLKHRVVLGLMGLALLVSKQASAGQELADSTKKDQSEVIQFGADIEGNYDNASAMDIQKTKVLEYPDYNYCTHKINSTYSLNAGPEITLFTHFKIWAKYDFSREKKGEQYTYWTKTDPVNYSCIGVAGINMDKWAYGITLQTSPIFKNLKITNSGVQLAVSYSITGAEIVYYTNYASQGQSGFAMNGAEPEHLYINGIREEITFLQYLKDNSAYFAVSIFGQQNFSGKCTPGGVDIKNIRIGSSIGVAVSIKSKWY